MKEIIERIAHAVVRPGRRTCVAAVGSMLLVMLCASAYIGYFGHPFQADPEFSEGTEAEETDGPDQAYMWRRLAQVDENGRVDKGVYSRALEQREQNRRMASADRAGISRTGWTSRGPQNVGGRTRSLVINPANPNVLWAGSVAGGVWRSNDAGQNWAPVNDDMANLAVSSLIMDPNNSSIMYCGTGEGYFNADALNGLGIFKSIDQGVNWTQLANTIGFGTVDRLSVAPGNSNIILAATAGGIRRSADGGTTWTFVRSAQRSLYVAFDPTNSNNAIAQILDYNFTTSQWFQDAIYSRNGGLTWQTSNLHTGDFNSRIELTYLASNPNIVLGLSPIASGAIVSRSTDGGVTFTQVTTTPVPEAGQMWYDNTIWVSPVDPNLVIIGLVYNYKSVDGGVSFNRITSGYILTQQPHPDAHCIVPDAGFNGTTNKRVYVCNDGGVFRTDDITTANINTGWVSLNQTYQTTQFYGVTGDGPSAKLYGGLQDNGSLLMTIPGTTATMPFGGDGGEAAIDPTNTNFMYGEYVALQLHRSTNGGGSASYIYSGISDAGGNANWAAPFILDPNEPNRMLAGGASLWRSNNVKAGTPTWTAIRPAGSDRISAIAVAKGNSNLIWVAQNDGKVFKTVNGTDAAPTWTVVDDNGASNPLPNRYPTRIVIDQDNTNIVYISFGGYSDGNLQKTVNGGTNWTDITGTGANGIPLAPIRGFARHPLKPGWLYAGTEVGIFASEDGGATWSTSNEGPGNVSIDELVFMANSTTLLAGTYGRGLWTTRIGSVSPFDFDGDAKTDLSIFRPGPGEWWYLNSSNGGNGAATFGSGTDKLTPGDFTGDGKTDIAIWRPSTGEWFILRSENQTYYSFPFGTAGDVPAPADFDADGRTDAAVFRPLSSTWFISNSSGGTTIQQFGQAGDVPVTADYDGDGKSDIAIYRPAAGEWWLLRSTAGLIAFTFGNSADRTVPGDYTGDGKADVGIWRPSTGEWFILRSENQSYYSFPFGTAGDVPSPGDYDGDGKFDAGVFRPSGSTWFVNKSGGGTLIQTFGQAGDLPVPSAFVR